MKQKFSTKWNRSTQIRKQRKFAVNAPLHIKNKFLSSNLSKPLRQKYKTRNITLRKGDEVKIMRGKFKGKQGKVNLVDLKNTKITIEGLNKKKKDGTKINVYFHPSKVQIITLNDSDKKRFKRNNIKTEEKKPKQESKPIEENKNKQNKEKKENASKKA